MAKRLTKPGGSGIPAINLLRSMARSSVKISRAPYMVLVSRALVGREKSGRAHVAAAMAQKNEDVIVLQLGQRSQLPICSPSTKLRVR
jgi:hypothetical protein